MRRFAVAFLVITFAATNAFADATPEERSAARTMLLDGYKRLEAGDAKRALELFRSADGVMNVPTTRLAVAQALERLGQLVEARAALEQIESMPKRPDDPAAFVKARADAHAKLADLAKRIPEIAFEGGDVTIDGAAAKSPQHVNPGAHVVALGGREEHVIVAEGEHKVVRFGATTPLPLPAPPPAEETTHMSPLVWIGFGVAVVGAGVGTFTGISAKSKKDDALATYCNGNKCPPAADSDLDSASTLATVSTISFVVAAVGAGVGIYGLLNPTRTTAVVVGPSSVAVRAQF
jgi:hypothetical protein